jgi:hypothetical protein
MRTATVVMLLMLAAGCGSDASGPMGVRPSVSLTFEQTTVTVQPGGMTSVMATMVGSGGHSGFLTLTVEGEPSGVVWSVEYTRTGPQAVTAEITILASDAAALGTYMLTVRGEGEDVDDRTATLTLIVAVTGGGGG